MLCIAVIDICPIFTTDLITQVNSLINLAKYLTIII